MNTAISGRIGVSDIVSKEPKTDKRSRSYIAYPNLEDDSYEQGSNGSWQK